ncbi:MAG: FHA domain-containing protein [Planctomycetota bacterium]|nr:MAG: FHA domain-containing protein [Planctomycetota bacterium]
MPSLEILSGKHAGQVFSFAGDAKIGKDDSCTIQLTDPGVSRFHAQVRVSGGTVQIEDLGSSNGTYVNFKKRAKGDPATLNDKDIVFFGRTVSKFWATAPEGGRGGVPVELLRETVPIKGLTCPKCQQDIEVELAAAVREAERVEIVRRLGLHETDVPTLQRLLQLAGQ